MTKLSQLTIRLLAMAALLCAFATSGHASLESIGKLDLSPYDPDSQLPGAAEAIAQANCSANMVVALALGNNADAAREQLGAAIENYGSAADRLNSLADGAAFDGLAVDPGTPGLSTMGFLFETPPEEIDDIIRAIANRADTARDAATRIQSGNEQPDDLITLMTASSEITMLLTLLGEALVVSA